MNLPHEAIEIYTDILNYAVSMGYFPNKVRQAKIKLIPKANTS